jgi:hypothetical protein
LDQILDRRLGKEYFDNLSPEEEAAVARELAGFTKSFDAKNGTSL